MAIKSTIYKAELQISDLDRGYYHTHALTLAMHPSETEERLMMRLLAFALHADEALSFGGGLSTEDEPDLWRKDLTGVIELWIEVGQPDEKRIRRACGRSQQVVIYTYSGRGAQLWWDKISGELARCKNLRVFDVAAGTSAELAALAQRSMRLQCIVQDGELQLMSETCNVNVVLGARM
jgi:uncharacterized protein YaeQ